MPSLLTSTCLAILLLIGIYSLTTFLSPGRSKSVPSTAPKRHVLAICLGSGGHTTEMFYMLRKLDMDPFHRCNYYISAGDSLSLHKCEMFESRRAKTREGYKYRTRILARARKVKQSWLTTPLTAILSLFDAIRYIAQDRPDMLLCNGPGTCVMLVLACLLLRYSGVKKCRIIFVESFARVKRLSLSGKILIHLVDRFLVMWPELAERYDKAEYAGLLI